jgi:hypothetical protein
MGVMSRTMVGDTLRDTPVTVSRVSRTMVGDTPSHISLAVLARVKLKIFFQIVPSSAGLTEPFAQRPRGDFQCLRKVSRRHVPAVKFQIAERNLEFV